MIARSAWASARGGASPTSASGVPSAPTRKSCASWESGNAVASQAEQTTPPAAPLNPLRWSPSPHDAQAASCGANPAASSSLSRKASALARVARAASASSSASWLREQVVDAAVGVVVVEQARHRVAGARGAVERGAVVAQPRVAGERLRARDREQVAAPLVEHEPQAEERLQPPAEARLRPPDALRDRRQPPALGREQVQDPVRLAVADRPQDDGLGLQTARHRVSLANARTILCEVGMSRVTVYTTEPCGYCRTAKALLDRRGVPYEEINLAKDADGPVRARRRSPA